MKWITQFMTSLRQAIYKRRHPTSVPKNSVSISRLRLELTRILAACILLALAIGTAYWAGSSPIVAKTLFIIGIILVSFGATGRAWATAYISGKKLTCLIQTGPYSLCRNPLYFFSMLLALGFGFCTATVTIPFLILLIMAVLYYFQIRREEHRLAEIFGREYEAYLATTPRFIPSFKNYSEPDTICISTKPFMRGLFGIAFLLLLIAVLKLLEAFHESALLPTYFHIY